MKAKRIIAMFTAFILALSLINIDNKVYAKEDVIEHINNYIKEFYGINHNFYERSNSYGAANIHRAQQEWERYGVLLNPIVYGGAGSVYLSSSGGSWYQNVSTIGRDVYGNPVVSYMNDDGSRNMDFYKWNVGWGGGELYNVKTPYTDPGLENWYIRGKAPDYERNTYFTRYYSKDGAAISLEKELLLEAAIQKGMDAIYAGIQGKHLDNGKDNVSISQREKYIHHAGSAPSGGWLNHLLIVVPPTDISWGVAWRYNKEGNKSIDAYYTIEIPIAPFNMVGGDIRTDYVQATSSANVGEKVVFETFSEADFEKSENVSYEWSIKTASGQNVPSVSYSGDGFSSSGRVDISNYMPAQFRASFTMPNEDVIVSFVINGDKKLPESNYENNRAEIDPVTVKLIKPLPPKDVGQFDLDYDIYARKIGFNGADMSASFMPKVKHIGNGYATYNVWSNKPHILQYLSVNANNVVDTNPFTVRPYVQGIVMREGFGDNPGARIYKADGHYTEDAQVNITGSTWRKYLGLFGEAWDYSSFTLSVANLSTTAKVYNGRASLTAPYTQNSSSGTEVKWTSDKIDFGVTRKMYLLDENGNRTNEINAPGKYRRSFVGQNSATVSWIATKSLAQSYAQDRETAKKRGTNYINAIFASDKEFSNVPFPIKSGYMFNPAATYVCTVSSSVFCDSEMTPEEQAAIHEELVRKAIASFVYNNELQYTNTGKDSYYLKGVKKGNEQGILKIKRSDKKNSVYLAAGDYESCMEGYAASGTLDSYNNYKYREYVSDYSVTRFDAETVITFTISSPKRYTHIGMKDGNYPITAKSNSFNFRGMTVPGQNLNDGIVVTVKGSMYDDRN